MKKIKNLSEGEFLKLFFAFFTAAFLIAAVIMPDRGTMLSGLWTILTSPAKVTTNYWGAQIFTKTQLKDYVQYLPSVKAAANANEEE